MHNRITKYFDDEQRRTIDVMNIVGIETTAKLQKSQAEVDALRQQIERLTSAVDEQDEIIDTLWAMVDHDGFFSE